MCVLNLNRNQLSMVNNYDDTIFSLATAVGRSATAMVRISGPRVNDVPELLGFARPEPKIASVRILKHQKKKLDQSIVLFFKGPESYTGEDVMELHLHGGRAVIEGVYSALSAQKGFRFAENGEFSKRAVINGRIDLTEAEGINDLINAETEAQRDQGLNQLEGALRLQLEKWSNDLKGFGAHIEAYIDFPDEQIPENVLSDLLQGVEETNRELKEFVDDDRKGEILRSGLKVAVIGPPNVGKSSFVNWLTKRDIAITSEKAGTTRDIVEAHLDLGGYPVTVADTAGIRESEDTIEQEGIRRARSWSESADLRVLILDPETAEDANAFSDLLKSGDPILMNKADRITIVKKKMSAAYSLVSVKTGYGLESILSELTTIAKRKMGTQKPTTITQARHRALLNDCLTALREAHFGLRNHADLELIAEDFRSAIYCIGRITGHIDVEDLLDVVFKEFCIGK